MIRSATVACMTLGGVLAGHARPIEATLGAGDVLRMEPVAAALVRVRLSPHGRFEPSLMERHGIVRTDRPACDFTTQQDGGTTVEDPSRRT